MAVIKNVDLTKKANVYFDGNVTSRSFVDSEGESKSLGIMMPGTYTLEQLLLSLWRLLKESVK